MRDRSGVWDTAVPLERSEPAHLDKTESSKAFDPEVAMLKAAIIGITGFVLGAGTVEAISWTKTEVPRPVAPAAPVGMPSIDEFHTKARGQNLPDLTVKEPY